MEDVSQKSHPKLWAICGPHVIDSECCNSQILEKDTEAQSAFKIFVWRQDCCQPFPREVISSQTYLIGVQISIRRPRYGIRGQGWRGLELEDTERGEDADVERL